MPRGARVSRQKASQEGVVEVQHTLNKLRAGTGHVPLFTYLEGLLKGKRAAYLKKVGTSREEIRELREKTYIMGARWKLSDFRQPAGHMRDHTREDNRKDILAYLLSAIGTNLKELNKSEFAK